MIFAILVILGLISSVSFVALMLTGLFKLILIVALIVGIIVFVANIIGKLL